MSLTLVGGTGGLGMEVAKSLVKSTGFTAHNAIVRDITKASALEEMGWKLVEVKDYFNTKELEDALRGTKVVVSAFGGSDVVKLDVATVYAAKNVGTVKLFVPSRFGVDYRYWSTSNPYIAGKLQVTDVAKEVGLPILSVACGLFSDWIFDSITDPINGKARIIGDGSAQMTFTRRSDIGMVLAKALEDPDLMKYPTGGNVVLCISGETLAYKDAIATLEKVTNKKFDIEYIDSAVALQQEQELLAKGLEGDVGAFWASFALHLTGEPARGNRGLDCSEEAKSYGLKLETLSETLETIYGWSKK